MLPTIEAVAAIVLACAIADEGKVALQLYEQLRRQGAAALSGLLQRGSRLFELLMEGCCRSGRVHEALAIFDDWKAARDIVVQHHLQSKVGSVSACGLSEQGVADDASIGGTADGGAAVVACDNHEHSHAVRLPKLSNVTLAFLEASCHACSDQEDVRWRMYDVCALMRQQEEDKRARRLPRPKKGSHHVKENDVQ
jgi:pentatricopeptide repeat protein